MEKRVYLKALQYFTNCKHFNPKNGDNDTNWNDSYGEWNVKKGNY